MNKKPLKRTIPKRKKRTRPEQAKLIDKLWDLFSVYIRTRDKGKCFTCGATFNWHETDAGHFISRRMKSVLFDSRNVHAQCRKCNRFLYGNVAEYSARLINKYGIDTLNDLIRLSHKIKQWEVNELKRLIVAIKISGEAFEKEYKLIRDKIK